MNFSTFFKISVLVSVSLCFVFCVSCSIRTSHGEKLIARIYSENFTNNQWRFIGSGVLIYKENDKDEKIYYLLTASHVVRHQFKIKIATYDGTNYPIDQVSTPVYSEYCPDAALLKFSSTQSYEVAKLEQGVKINENISLNGWVENQEIESDPKLKLIEGKVLSTETDTIKNEQDEFSIENSWNDSNNCFYSDLKYQLQEESLSGMSGSPIFNEELEVIGIHNGLMAFPPKQMRGVSIHRLVHYLPDNFFKGTEGAH